MLVKIASLTVQQLKDFLSEKNLKTTGTKAELMLRLSEVLRSDEIEMCSQNIVDEELETTQSQNGSLQEQINELKEMLSGVVNALTQMSATSVSQPRSVISIPVVGNVNEMSSMTSVHNRYSVKEIAETIPDFDPTNYLALTAEQFIERVNSAMNAYVWEEKCVLLAVYSRMKGVARLWLDGQQSLFATWRDFSNALIEEFGTKMDEADINYIMSSTTRKQGEKVIEYCFRMSATGKRYGLSESAIIKYTREGLKYRDLQSAIAVLKFNTMKEMRETLDEYLKNLPTTSRNTYDNTSKKTETKTAPNEKFEKSSEKLTCYNCSEKGHLSSNCSKPQNRPRCKDCQRVHPRNDPVNCGKNVNVRACETSKMFEKEIYINGERLIAFIDSGSDCHMVRESIAKKISCKIMPCIMRMKGICGGTKISKNKINVSMQVDTVNLQLDMYVVQDDFLSTDVLLGHEIFINDFIVTINNVDSFTKFTILRAVKGTVTKHVVELLKEISSYVGIPERIVTDRGPAFTSKQFQQYCQENVIKHILNAVQTPRANAHAERTNRTVLSMLLPSTTADDKWDNELSKIQWSINTMRNGTTNKTPHELLFNFTPRDILKNKLILALNDDNQINCDIEQIRKEAAMRINEKRLKAKQRFDSHHRIPHVYKEGDLVLAENAPPCTGFSRKLEPRYKGPFEIGKVLDRDRYVIQDLPGSRRKQRPYKSVYASDKLKRYCEPTEIDDICCAEDESEGEDVN
ncbi:uncharacterized protein [Eurosta solidaginis]|uniref:uncharacterized protein n=1 Tax=Eurosta solidaginis TaxID=178769 RepID=UPI003530A7FE